MWEASFKIHVAYCRWLWNKLQARFAQWASIVLSKHHVQIYLKYSEFCNILVK